MPLGERVRAWADGEQGVHPDDEVALASYRASAHPLLRAAVHTYAAERHLAQFRFDAALAECLSAEHLLAAPVPAGATLGPLVDAGRVECWIRYVHAEALDELGHYDAAAALLDASAEVAQAHRLELSWARAVSKRIWIARQQGDAGLAAARLRELAGQLSPRSHLLCSTLASTLSWLGRPETALSYAQRCLTLPTGQARRTRDHRDLARTLVRLGRFDEARHHLELAEAKLARNPATLRDKYVLLYAQYHHALARGAYDTAAGIAVEAAHGVAGAANLRRQLALLGLARAQHLSGRIDAMATTMRQVDTPRLGAEHRALARRLEAAVAERDGDWQGAALALGEAREIMASRHLAIPVVLLIEAELAVADPFAADLLPATGDGRAAEFNRAIATRDQLLMAAAKDLRGPIAVFELGADLLADPDVESDRVALLIERALTEMELLVDQLRDTEIEAAAERPAPDAGHPLGDVIRTALTRLEPIATARRVPVELSGDLDVTVSRATATVNSALTSVLALTIRAAAPGNTVAVAVAGPQPTVTIDLTAADAAPRNWAAADSITAATAGGPTAWALATTQLAELGGRLTAERTGGDRVRVTLATAAP